ncbi:MAG: GNAT family protein [Actinomycetota bacterium]
MTEITKLDWRLVPITEAHAQAISTWTYEEPYSLYNSSPEAAEWLLDPLNNYFAVVDGTDDLVAFCCYGHDARVPGGTYDDEAIDWGTGMRPDLTGQGRGTNFFDLVCDEARTRWPGHPLRTTIAAFNERSQRIVRKLGFKEIEIFRNPANREFVVFLSG